MVLMCLINCVSEFEISDGIIGCFLERLLVRHGMASSTSKDIIKDIVFEFLLKTNMGKLEKRLISCVIEHPT
nr:hypothetical protein [Tanacetum cinerariifolium]